MAWSGTLQGWTRRKSKFIYGTSAGNQPQYQLMITVYVGGPGQPVDTSTAIFCGGNCRNDFSDIRFSDSDGSTLLNYWIESTNTDIMGLYANIWVNVGNLPVAGKNIYIYYNNPYMGISASNANNTFLFYDNFTEYYAGLYAPFGSWSKDPNAYNTQIVSNGKLMTRFGYDDIYQRSGITAYSHSYNFNLSVEGKMYLVSPVFQGCSFFVSPLSGGTMYGSSNNFVSAKFSTGCDYDAQGIKIQTSVNGSQYTYSLSTTVSINTWYNFRVAAYNRTVYVKMWQVGTEPSAWTFTQSIPAGQWPTTNGPIELFSYNMQPYADAIRVRNFANPEPSFGPSSNEELNITATDMAVDKTFCIGQCAVNTFVTWYNYGNADIVDFAPGIEIDHGTPQATLAFGFHITIPSLGSASSGAITTPTLSIGTHTICPYPN